MITNRAGADLGPARPFVRGSQGGHAVSSPILPVARSLILCDAVTADGTGKLYLAGAFNSIRARSLPHSGTRVVVFAQLTGGVGVVPARVEVRHALRDEVVCTAEPLSLHFPDRLKIVQMSTVLTRCVFLYPGMYTVELFCHNQFVCDTALLLNPTG
jgi:hypothetical protein